MMGWIRFILGVMLLATGGILTSYVEHKLGYNLWEKLSPTGDRADLKGHS